MQPRNLPRLARDLVPARLHLAAQGVHLGLRLALPPHGLLLFVVNGLTGIPLAEIFREMPVFVATMLVVLIAVTLLPDLATTLPRLFGYATH